MLYLQTSHPQVFYKPLFSLSASTNSTTLVAHLRLVRALSAAITPSRYWTSADPQMVVIVLMGGAAPRPSKGKGKEGEPINADIRLGRYACAVELLQALDGLEASNRKDKKVRAFIETVESSLGMMLDAEVCVTRRRQADERLIVRRSRGICLLGIGRLFVGYSTSSDR